MKPPFELGPAQKLKIYRDRVYDQDRALGFGLPKKVAPGSLLHRGPFVLVPLGLGQDSCCSRTQVAQEDAGHGVGCLPPPAGHGGRRFVAAPFHIMAVQSQDIPPGQLRKHGKAVGGRHDRAGEHRIEFVGHGEAAGAAGGTEVGFERDVRHIALASGLQERASRRMIAIDASDPQSDELCVGEIEAISVVFECRDEIRERVAGMRHEREVSWPSFYTAAAKQTRVNSRKRKIFLTAM